MTIYDINTNIAGREFLKKINNCEILGLITPQENSRRESYVLYRSKDKKIYCCVVPQSDGKTTPCYFGDLEYFAIIYACSVSGIKCQWNKNDRPAWPSWFMDFSNKKDREKWGNFIDAYNNIINKCNNNNKK